MDFKVIEEKGHLKLFAWMNEKYHHLPALWLRERALGEDQINAATNQRIVNSHDFPEDLYLLSARIEEETILLQFSDGCHLTYPQQFLSQCLNPLSILPEKIIWKADLGDISNFSWSEIQNHDEYMKAITFFLQYGFIIITDTPTKKDTIEIIAKHFGYIRNTNFGTIFDIYSRPNPNDLSYTSVSLAPHTDNPYREPTPGIQLLHCLVNETTGGLSTLVDSLACLEALARINPKGFKLLSEISVCFTFDDDEVSLATERPMIALSPSGEIMGLHYSPRLDWMPLLEEEKIQEYHLARKQLATLFSDPAYELRFRLQPGACMIFDNNRVLHGRTSYDPQEGMRYLQGCYIDRDGPKSWYRRLQRDQTLPS